MTEPPVRSNTVVKTLVPPYLHTQFKIQSKYLASSFRQPMSPTDFFSRISVSEEYQSFRGSIPLKKITVEEDKTWQVYDTGPKSQAVLPTSYVLQTKTMKLFSDPCVLCPLSVSLSAGQQPPALPPSNLWHCRPLLQTEPQPLSARLQSDHCTVAPLLDPPPLVSRLHSAPRPTRPGESSHLRGRPWRISG